MRARPRPSSTDSEQKPATAAFIACHIGRSMFDLPAATPKSSHGDVCLLSSATWFMRSRRNAGPVSALRAATMLPTFEVTRQNEPCRSSCWIGSLNSEVCSSACRCLPMQPEACQPTALGRRAPCAAGELIEMSGRLPRVQANPQAPWGHGGIGRRTRLKIVGSNSSGFDSRCPYDGYPPQLRGRSSCLLERKLRLTKTCPPTKPGGATSRVAG